MGFGQVQIKTVLVSTHPSDWVGCDPEFGRGFLVISLCFPSCWPKAKPLSSLCHCFSLPHLPILVDIPLFFSVCLWWWLLAVLPRIFPPRTPFPGITSPLQLPSSSFVDELMFYSNPQCENKSLSKGRECFSLFICTVFFHGRTRWPILNLVR